MPKVATIQESFTTGELAPVVQGRVTSDRYKDALGLCENYVPTIQGAAIRRPGTRFVAATKDSTKKTRLVPFQFSQTQSYILEFGHLYVRFYTNRGQIQDERLHIPLEIATPYTEDEVDQLAFTQSADVIYIVHPNHLPSTITRDSSGTFVQGPEMVGIGRSSPSPFKPNPTFEYLDTTVTPNVWTTKAIDTNAQPYNINVNFQTLALPASTYTLGVTLFGSPVTFPAKFFDASMVGRFIWLKIGANNYYGQITAIGSGGASADVQIPGNDSLTGSSATFWRWDMWFAGNYPNSVCFHEDRLVYFGAKLYPQQLDFSASANYNFFIPTKKDGSVPADYPIQATLNSTDVNAGRWITSDEKGLLCGSSGAEWVVKPSNPADALSATNISAKRATSWGALAVAPVLVGKATLFIQKSGRRLREFLYFYDVDGFQANDLTVLSEHILNPGVKCIASQKENFPLVWCVRNDGIAATMTYLRDGGNVRAGWARQILGGKSDATGTQAKIESIAVIPTPDGLSEDVWFVVQRWVNGTKKRYIEYLTKFFDDTMDKDDAVFVDCSLTFDAPLVITGISSATTAVVTSTAHGLTAGQKVRIKKVVGLLDSNGVSVLNGNVFTVGTVTTNTFELVGVNSTALTPYVAGGEARKLVTSISGLTHLEGESVQVWGDGGYLGFKTVASGAIALDAPGAGKVTIGYQTIARGQTLRADAGSANGTAIGKSRRINKLGILVYRTFGIKLGRDFNHLDDFKDRDTITPMGNPPELYSGILSQQFESDYDFDNFICFQQDEPQPGLLLAVFPQMETQDGG